MIGERVALLAGLFLAPVLLLWLGHGFHSRSARMKRMFWGGVIGHAAAVLVTLLAMLSPPVWWHGGSLWRDLAVHWSLLAGALIGAAIGLALGSRPLRSE